MLGVAVGVRPEYGAPQDVMFPPGFAWDHDRFALSIRKRGSWYASDVRPRDLVDPAIWTGPAFHVDGVSGNDENTGLGVEDGDFSAAKRTIYSAFIAGNATGQAYRVIVKPGTYEGTDFTRNGNEEPTQPLAIIGWQGIVHYRTGPFSVDWKASIGTYRTSTSAVRRVFRTDVKSQEGLYQELSFVADVATCESTPYSWTVDGAFVHINIGREPAADDIALIRGFHGARFLAHDQDFFCENLHIEGGISGALHFDAPAHRNIVGVRCSFRYSAPNNPSAPLDAVRIRRTNGLVAFFDCDASAAAKDGWSFHDDGTEGMHVLLENCSAWRNGVAPAASVNALTTHDEVRALVLNGAFGLSRNGTEVHTIQQAQTWIAGTTAIARDIDGTSTAYQCSGDAQMWLQDSVADAGGAAINYAVEANSGDVYTRDLNVRSGEYRVVSGGFVTSF